MDATPNLKTEGSIVIHAGAAKVWDVLTHPDTIKIYMFGSVTKTTWTVASALTFSREHQGIRYTDKGQVLNVVPNKLLRFTYWSSQEGYEDVSENYSIITYRLLPESHNETKFTYCREHIPTAFELKNQENYLPTLLRNVKLLSELTGNA